MTPAAVIYVDPSGSDDPVTGGERGTLQPVATLARAIALAQPTDEIVLNPGFYYGVSEMTLYTPNVFISGYGATLVAASPGLNVLTISGIGCTVAGLTIDGGRTTPTAAADRGLININADNVLVQDCTLRNDVGNGVRMLGPITSPQAINNVCLNLFCAIQAYGNVDNLRISGNTLSAGWSAASGSGGIKLTASTYSGGWGTNYVISDNLIDSAGEMGIEAWGGYSFGQISNNTVRYSTFNVSQDTGSQTTISNNELVGGSYCGVELVNSDNIIVSDNTIDGLQADGVSYGSNAVIASGATSSECKINNNNFLHFTCAFNLRGALGFSITYNTISRDRPGQGAIALVASSWVSITHNDIRQTRSDCSYVLILDSSTGDVNDNTFSENQVESDRGGYYYSIQGYRNGGAFLVRNTLISNNTFVNAAGQVTAYNAFGIPMVTDSPGGTMQNTTISGNRPTLYTLAGFHR